MSYHRDRSGPEVDPLLRELSPYVAVLPSQPTATTCVAAAFDAVRRAIDAAGSFIHDDLTPLVEATVGQHGWTYGDLATAVSTRFPHYLVRPVAGPDLPPSHDRGFVVIIPGPGGGVGHAVAITHQDPALVWDPWGGGTLRPLRQEEAARWEAVGYVALEIRLR